MKLCAFLLLTTALAFSHATLAVDFSGAALHESELYELWGKENCSSFMVTSMSAKNAMPNVLSDYLNAGLEMRKVKILQCKYKTIKMEFYLAMLGGKWAMFRGDAVAVVSKHPHTDAKP